MAVAIIDAFEEIEIHDCKGVALPAETRQLRQEPPTVSHTGQHVRVGRSPQCRLRPLLDQHQCKERNGEVADDQQEEGVGRGDRRISGLSRPTTTARQSVAPIASEAAKMVLTGSGSLFRSATTAKADAARNRKAPVLNALARIELMTWKCVIRPAIAPVKGMASANQSARWRLWPLSRRKPIQNRA